jgi:UDP-N-acetylmuramoyl-tripeptide--D-alanyl-D-alanine ligase
LQGQLLDNETISIKQTQLSLPLAGTHNASNFLAAIAIAEALNIDWALNATNLTVNMPGGRSQRYELAGDIVILDETYNAGLESMIAALQLLAQTPGNRRIAVLGSMKELGEFSNEFHTQVGAKVKELNLDALLILVDGTDAQAIANAAMPLAVECFTTPPDLVRRLGEFVQKGDRLLFKASHSVGLDRVVSQFRTAYNQQL